MLGCINSMENIVPIHLESVCAIPVAALEASFKA